MEEKDNLIQLIQSGDESNLELAIQLNIGQKLLDWEEFWHIMINNHLHIAYWIIDKPNRLSYSDLVERLCTCMIAYSSKYFGIVRKDGSYNDVILC